MIRTNFNIKSRSSVTWPAPDPERARSGKHPCSRHGLTTRIILARHGETEWNVAGRMQGRKDSPLTRRGREQAVMLRLNLERYLATCTDTCSETAGNRLAAGWSSSLGRAVETLGICLKDMDVPLYKDDRLDEIGLGPWEGLSLSQVEAEWPDRFHAFWNCPSKYMPVGDGERFEDVQKRMCQALADMAGAFMGGNILVISHWIAIKCALARIMELGLDAIPYMPKPENAAFTVLEIRSGHWFLALPHSVEEICRD